jgi:hypothetical protein
MLELTVLLISITVLLLFVYFKNNKIAQNEIKEPFENFYLSGCPSGYKSFYSNNGDIVCCDGEIIANKCISDNQCTLNGNGTADMPNCTELIKRIYAEKAKQYCMPALPNYFEDKSKKIKGCMVGQLNDTMTGPQHSSQAKCIIYDTYEKNTKSIDSCANQKMLDLAQCFGKNCSKQLIKHHPLAPPLVAIQFTDNKGMPHTAYTRMSVESMFDVMWQEINPNFNWRNDPSLVNRLSKDINIAEVAKAYYIDKTITKDDIDI